MTKFGLEIRVPIAYIVWPSEWLEKDVRGFYTEYGEALRTGKVRGEVWDLAHINPVFTTASQRKLVSECVKQITPFLHGKIVAAGRIVPHGLIRGLVTAVDWLTGNYEHPVQNFSTSQEAERFVISKLIAARVPVPERPVSDRSAFTGRGGRVTV